MSVRATYVIGGIERIHWTQTSQSSADSETSETHFCDGGVDDTLLTKLVQQAFCYLRRS
jgi:hypothetical protein